MQRLVIVVGLVAVAVMLQGCGTQLAAAQAAVDHGIAVTTGCNVAVDEKLKPSVDKYNTDSQAYCDTLTDTAKKGVCVSKRSQFQSTCGTLMGTKWKFACVQNNSATIMNATAIEAAVTAYIDASDTEAADGMVSGYVTMTETCNTAAIVAIKAAVAAPTSRLYDATMKPKAAEEPKAAEAEPFFFAMTGFITVMVVGSLAFGVKRFVRNRMSGTGVAEADQEAQALEEHLGEVE